MYKKIEIELDNGQKYTLTGETSNDLVLFDSVGAEMPNSVIISKGLAEYMDIIMSAPKAELVIDSRSGKISDKQPTNITVISNETGHEFVIGSLEGTGYPELGGILMFAHKAEEKQVKGAPLGTLMTRFSDIRILGTIKGAVGIEAETY